jgi:hypothetical protein
MNSCSAKGNGDVDDDVSWRNLKSLIGFIIYSSVVMSVMIHLKISLMIIEKNGVWKMPNVLMEKLIIQFVIKMFNIM